MVADGSVTVLSHPSLQGMASGTGLSGSTAWHGAFRFRQYLTSVKPIDGEQPDNDLRELQFKKNQYGPLGENVVLRWRNGLFLPEPGISSLDKIAREAKADEMFLNLLKRLPLKAATSATTQAQKRMDRRSSSRKPRRRRYV
jgi:RecA-family ATPase